MTSKSNLCAAACFVAAVSTVAKADFYVDAQNGSDLNDGSIDAPWASIEKARETVFGDDIIVVADGDYGSFFEAAPPPNAGLHLFRAAKGATPRFNTIRLEYGSSQDANVTFDGFEVYSESATTLVGFDRANNVQFLNGKVSADRWSRGPTTPVNGLTIRNSNNVLVEGTSFSEILRGMQVASSSNVTLRSNVIEVKGGSGIQWVGGNRSGLIEANQIYAVRYTPYPTDPLAFDDPHQSAISVRSNDLVIRNNTIYDIGTSSGIMLYEPDAAGGEAAYMDITIEGNVLKNITNNNAVRIYNLGERVVLRNNVIFARYRSGPCDGYTNDARYRYNVALTIHNVAPGYDPSGLELYDNTFVGAVFLPAPATESGNEFWSLNVGGDWLANPPPSSATVELPTALECPVDPLGGSGVFIIPGHEPTAPPSSTIYVSAYLGCGNHPTVFEDRGLF